MNISNDHSNRQRPPQPGYESDAPSFGHWLRRQREVREISLREIADVTKISIRYLEALEQDRFDVLPAPVFAKGFLREYARYVGLDPDDVVNSYLTAQNQSEPEESPPPIRGAARASATPLERSSGVLLAAAVVAILAIVAGLIYYMERSPTVTEPPAMAAPPIQSVPEQPTVGSDQSTGAPLVVTIEFSGENWVEATIDNSRRIGEAHVPGESLRLEAQESVVLTLRDPSAARVEVNGVPFPLAEQPLNDDGAVEINLLDIMALDQSNP